MNTITLKAPCFTVQNGRVVDGTLADFDRFIETTTRPTGVGYKYYATTTPRRIEAVFDDDGNEIEPERTDDVWALAKWATWGGPEVIISEFETEEEAQSAAEATYVSDILNNQEFCVHLDRASADEELKSILVEE